MTQPDIITVPFGENAAPETINPIPVTRDSGDDPQQATWSEGFPRVTMQPLVTGGIPPKGQDFNGILKALSEHTVFQNAGGVYKWSAAVVASGGYDKGAVVQADDGLSTYISTIDNNTVNFNTTPSAIGDQWAPGGGSSKADADDSRIIGAAQKSANLSDLADAATARDNLGLGKAATRNVGEGSGNVMQVGAFGLGDTARVNSTTDADDLVSTGFFGNYGGAQILNAMNPTNKNYRAQLGMSTLDTVITYRNRTPTSGWSDTVILHHTGNILTSTGQSTQYPMTQKAVTDGLNTKASLNNPGTMGIGVGQTWQDVTASRVLGTTYTNTTGKTIAVSLYTNESLSDAGWIYRIDVDGIMVARMDRFSSSSGNDGNIFAIVPPGSSYRIIGSVDINYFVMELR